MNIDDTSYRVRLGGYTFSQHDQGWSVQVEHDHAGGHIAFTSLPGPLATLLGVDEHPAGVYYIVTGRD